MVARLLTSLAIQPTSFKVKGNGHQADYNAETENVSYLPNVKAYEIQTWYSDGALKTCIINNYKHITSKVKVASSRGTMLRQK